MCMTSENGYDMFACCDLMEWTRSNPTKVWCHQRVVPRCRLAPLGQDGCKAYAALPASASKVTTTFVSTKRSGESTGLQTDVSRGATMQSDGCSAVASACINQYSRSLQYALVSAGDDMSLLHLHTQWRLAICSQPWLLVCHSLTHRMVIGVPPTKAFCSYFQRCEAFVTESSSSPNATVTKSTAIAWYTSCIYDLAT